jgi:serine protease Do
MDPLPHVAAHRTPGMNVDHMLRTFRESRCFSLLVAAGLLGLLTTECSAAGDSSPEPAAAMQLPNLTDIVARVEPSVVVITFSGRDGDTQGLGTGFIVREDGLIATNLHVIGEARPIQVRTFDGTRYDVKQIYAHEHKRDLAILKIDADGLPALTLGDPDELQQGQPVVAFGNPEGLEYSVVTGIVSALREDVDGRSMIQLAIPIERGNSGGPVVDLEGHVHGLLTLKSLVTDNLGYAVSSEELRPLLEDPNPVSMSQWLTIGTLNPKRWKLRDDGASWTQRSGHIRVQGVAGGFGGRSLCLSTQEVPAVPFELAVSVRMEEEDGAAGLIFHADGDRHYGFYPSSGQLRLSRFDGPTVYNWHVLHEEASPHYRAGEWNRLKVRVEPGRFLCYCNGALVFTVDDDAYDSGQVGLAKFRHTTAEFRRFAVASELPSEQPDDATLERVAALGADIETSRPPTEETVTAFSDLGRTGRAAIEQEARLLEQRVERLRQLSRAVHEQAVRRQLFEVLAADDSSVDLLHAALLLAALDNDELDVDLYRREVDDLAAEFVDSLPEDCSEADTFAALNRFLFEERGFHGSRTNFYNASNSYLNEVIDDREGLPISLSVFYMEIARRAGLKVEGIGLPAHFVVQFVPKDGDPQLVDVFDRGVLMTVEDAERRVVNQGLAWEEEYLRPQTPTEIIARMLHNLKNLANNDQDAEAALRYTETILALNPDSAEDRLFKAVLCYSTGRAREGLEEVDWIFENEPEGILLGRLQQLRDALEELQQQEEEE